MMFLYGRILYQMFNSLENTHISKPLFAGGNMSEWHIRHLENLTLIE